MKHIVFPCIVAFFLILASCNKDERKTTISNDDIVLSDCFNYNVLNDSVTVISSLTSDKGWYFYPCWNSGTIVDNILSKGTVIVLNDSASVYQYIDKYAELRDVNLENESLLLLFNYCTGEIERIDLSYFYNNDRPTLKGNIIKTARTGYFFYLICLSVPKLPDSTIVSVEGL